MIYIDSNEPATLVGHVMDKNGECRRKDMPTGDLVVADRIIERKEMNDFVKRLTTEDISIWRQLDAMEQAGRESGYEPMLLLEGSYASIRSHISDASVVGAVAAITRRGISVVPTPDVEGTAQFLVTLDDDSDHGVESVRQSPSISERERPQHIVEGLPNVGPSRAVALLDHFGDPLAVMTATTEMLCEVDGIGPATAEEIGMALRRSDPV